MTEMDSTVCAFAFFAMVHWVYRWYNPKGTIPPERFRKSSIGSLLMGSVRAKGRIVSIVAWSL